MIDDTTPRVLSIIQQHDVGVTHYLLGGIAATWVFFLVRIIGALKGHGGPMYDFGN
jgi:photosystem I P700 chlorophyll a apoprotein A1